MHFAFYTSFCMNIAALCYASAAYSAVRRPSVCISVCHVRIVSKRTAILVFIARQHTDDTDIANLSVCLSVVCLYTSVCVSVTFRYQKLHRQHVCAKY